MKKPDNIIFICIDALRFDCIGVEKNKTLIEKYISEQCVDTPTIDFLATRGVRFSQAVTAAPYTTSSIASLLTGVYPPAHGMREFFRRKLGKDRMTMTEFLRGKDYTPVYSCEFPYSDLLDLCRGADYNFDGKDNALFDFLKNHKKNIFLFSHFFDTHDPYSYCENEIYPGYNDDYFQHFKFLKNEYKIEVKENKPYRAAYRNFLKNFYAESKISLIFEEYIKGVNKFDNGRLRIFIEKLSELGMLENSLFVVFSDHGEGPCKSHFGHGADLYDGILRIPLIFYFPGIFPKGQVIDYQVRTIDIFPTIIDLCASEKEYGELKARHNLEGETLLPFIFNGLDKHLPAYSEVWMHNASQEEIADFIDKCVEEKELYKPSYTNSVYQRSMRIPEYKCIMQGDSSLMDGDIKITGTDEEFIRSLYRNILRRIEDESGFNDWISKLKKNDIDRSELIIRFKTTEEAKNLSKLFDLKSDPFETKNLLRGNNISQYYPLFKKLSEMIELINLAGAEKSEEIYFFSSEERDEVEKKLKNLGYLG